MPEGDTIFRTAATLHRALAGKAVTRFETVLAKLARVDDDTPVVGRTIERVIAVGKHLLIELSGDLWLRTHMRMSGSWHIYRPGERWQKRRADMRVVIVTRDFEAVAFNVPIAEFRTSRDLDRDPELRELGPDLLGAAFDAAEAVRLARQHSDCEIADLLLNQHIAAGIGNVYKSEVLFVSGIDPFRMASTISDPDLSTVFERARKLLLLNVRDTRGSNRKTTGSANPSHRLWVYGRGGEPCRKCGTAIEARKQGPDARVTFWCARCQRTPATLIQ
ncbi:MAG TPA: DNA-formamidopyrimidine glycosylase family protein [Thermoanaerobaculia bacterium]|nr:DNA-formamidopyrimidine glycosylase family protein [Thermoanaerobaculia bacterium]